MGDVKIKIALGLIAIMILAAPIAIAQEVPPHVVISEVYPNAINDHSEWIELYNPTAEDVDIGGWTIDTATWLADVTIPTGATIPAHGFYLIADEDFSTEKDDPSWPDADLEEAITLTNDHGWCRLNNSGSFDDTVGWGTATTNETLNAVKPAKGESIERKSLDDGYAPCQDTDDNSLDFAVQDTPTPKNADSSAMEPAPVELFDADDKFKGGFVNIQDAVDSASDEYKYTIRVDNGTYNENVVVDKSLTICSEHGAAFTTIQAFDPDDNVIDVTADYVTITGFNVIEATGKVGVHLNKANYCNIADNIVSNNNISIHLQMSRYNTITNNYVSDNYNGIWLASSGDNTITNNHVSDNNQNGIRLSHSSDDNFIYNNYFENTNNALDDGNNIWDITKADGPNIIGGPYLGGNYWSDYTGDDNNDDGLGDTSLPYNSGGNIEDGGDSLPLVPEGEPILSIAKSDEPDHMHPGGTLNYTISVNNTGKATATNVNVTETYDANVTFISAVPAPSQGNDTWIFPTLNVDESKRINISVSVNPDTPNGTILHNRVNVTCDEGVIASDTEYTVIEDTCVLVETDVIVGHACFRTNGGTIEDLKTVDESTLPEEGKPALVFPYGFFSFNITGLENGQTVIVTITLPRNAPDGTEYWKYHDPAWVKIPIIGGDDGDSVINITLVDGELGDDDGVADGRIVDQGGPGGRPPKIIGFAPPSPVYDPKGAWRTFNVTVDQTVDVYWEVNEVVQGEENKSVRNASHNFYRDEGRTYNITAIAKNIYNFNDRATQNWTWIVKPTNISVTKVADVTEAKPSSSVNFTITVTNIGNTTLNRIVVEDQLREGLNYSNATDPTPNAITQGKDLMEKPVTNVIWYFNGSLAVNDSKTITLVANITEDAKGVLTNSVDVTGRPDNGTNATAYAITEVNVIRVAIEKSCRSTVAFGGTVTYTITYSNPGGTNLTDVVITENYPDALTFDSAVPAPDRGTNNKWTIGTLPAGGPERTITIEMKVPTSMSDLSYEESGNVAGEGIVMISKELSTVHKPYELENIVTISGSYEGTNVSASDSTITTVSMSGSSLEITEHGSGIYKSEEELSLSFEKGGIYFDKDTKAEYRPTTFNCSDGFVMEVTSKWSQDICSKNYAKKTAIHKTITGATYMDDNTRINSKNTRYYMDFDSSFDGYLRVGKKTKDAATSEHYIGKFVITGWDESGDESVEGVGYVIVDKELASGRLLLMEHGSGTYSSEEDSSSRKIYKTTYAVYEPTQFNFSDSFVVNFSSKWMQDFCAKKGHTALHKKIRDATYIDDDTRAKSSPSMYFESFFLGATHVGSRSLGSRASEDYIGEFYISWGAATYYTHIFDWDDVPGVDNDGLIRHLSEDKFDMPWVTDADVEITKPASDTINISTPEHSAEIILNTTTNETADLTVAGGGTFTFKVEKHGDTLRVYDTEFERKPEEVMGEGFVMLDESIIFKDGEIHVTEHGSGIYHSHEDFGSKTIEKETYGEYEPTYFMFSDSFAVNFSSKWVQDICAKDEKEGTAIRKRISDAALIKDDTIVAKSLMNITSSFNGSMHIGARTGDIRISEDYIGEFNVTQVIRIVKEKPSESSSDPSDWLFCPFPIALTTPPGDELTCLFPFDLSSTPATSHGLHTHWPWSCPSHWDWAPP